MRGNYSASPRAKQPFSSPSRPGHLTNAPVPSEADVWGEMTSFKDVHTGKRPPQEPHQARAGKSGIEAAAPVVGRSPAARAARGGTEGRRGHQIRKARTKPEPLEKPRSSSPQRVSAVRG